MLASLRSTYQRYPQKFWVLVLAVFVDMTGGTLLQPFIALYITQRFNVGMTIAGTILGLAAISGLVGSFIGGALTDRFGRRGIIIFGLICSALVTLSLGFVTRLSLLYPLAMAIGLIGSLSGPAHQAMVADLLPEEKRSQGFGILRVVVNLSWIIGPTIGGLIASQSFFMLFVLDSIVSCIVAFIFFKLMPETMPQKAEGEPNESIAQNMAGYLKVLTDRPYMAFLLVSILGLLVYQQMYSTLSVYMRDVRGFVTQQYGLLLSISAITVVLTQIWVSNRTKSRPPFLMLALGSLFYMLGFAMFGIFKPYPFFAVAIVVITIGEMISMPVAQALAARFAPEEMRGRYMATFSLGWTIPSAIGPAAAGLVMDNLNPNLVWLGGGVILLVAAMGYFALHLGLRGQARFHPEPETVE